MQKPPKKIDPTMPGKVEECFQLMKTVAEHNAFLRHPARQLQDPVSDRLQACKALLVSLADSDDKERILRFVTEEQLESIIEFIDELESIQHEIFHATERTHELIDNLYVLLDPSDSGT